MFSFNRLSEEAVQVAVEPSSGFVIELVELPILTVTFTWKKQKDYPPDIKGYDENSDIRKNNYINHGFIAQEVKEAIDKHESIKDGFGGWSIDDDNIQQVGDGAFMPMVIKALQELQKQN